MVDILMKNEEKFINSLQQRYGLFICDLSNYAEDHFEEIQRMNKIFNFETEEDIRLCICMVNILTPEWAKETIDYSRSNKFTRKIFKFVDIPSINDYVLKLVSAFRYNSDFLRNAWNWCVITYHEAKMEKERKGEGVEPRSDQSTKQGHIYLNRLAGTNRDDIKTIINETYIWKNIPCLIVGSLLQNGNVIIEFQIPGQNAQEDLTKINLTITMRKGDIFMREQPLECWNDSWEPGENIIYSTGEISVIDYDNIIIN